MSSPWEQEIPILAFSCDYLMHGMISTAALHLSYLDPEQKFKYELLSAQHQDSALPLFQAAMSDVTVKNCNQVFAFSLLIILTHSYSMRFPNFFEPFSEGCHWLPDWIVWHRGCHVILKQARAQITVGPLAPLLKEEERTRCILEADKQVSREEDDQSIQILLQHSDDLPSFDTSIDAREVRVCRDATGHLRQLLAASSKTEDTLVYRALTSTWLVNKSDDFI